MRRNRPLVALATAAGLLLASLGSDSAFASTGPASSGSVVGSTGSMSFTVSRRNWGLIYRVTVKDTSRNGACVYAKVRVDVDNGFDPSGSTAKVCGKGASRSFSGEVKAGMTGTSIRAAVVSVCGPALCASKTVPLAQSLPRNASLAGYYRARMNEPLASFLRVKASGSRNPRFNWADNGCSIPPPLGLGLFFDGDFTPACKRHDFGYRNGGQGLEIAPTDSERQRIDAKLQTDAEGICLAKYSGVKESRCLGEARTVYIAVHNNASREFFGVA